MSTRARFATAMAALVSGGALHVAGSGDLAAPPVGSWAALDAWYLRSGTTVAVLALVRLVALGGALWIAGSALLQLGATVVGSRRLSTAIDRVSPPFLRVVSTGVAGLSVTAGLALPGLPSAPHGNPPGTAVMVPVDAPVTSSTTTTSVPPPTSVPPTTSVSPTTTTTTSPEVAAGTIAPAPAAAPSQAAEVVVALGDSFWSIAVDEAQGRDLVGYWRALIEANRERLVDPSNPDLLYAGQVLRLP